MARQQVRRPKDNTIPATVFAKPAESTESTAVLDGKSIVSDQLPPLATPAEAAEYLHTSTAALGQDRYRGTGPKFIKRGSRVL